MKKMKKLLSLVLSVVMVVAMGVTTFADDAYKITIEKAMGTYKVYQVFKGDLVTKDGKKVLSNVNWGEGVDKFTYKIGQNEDGSDKMSDNAAEIAKYLSGKGDTEAKAFAAEAAKHVKATATAEKSVAEGKQEDLTIDGLTAGYYVVLNSDVASGQEISRYILQVVGDASVVNKANTVSSEKKVKDTNDTTGDTTDWQDSADYDIGDKVPFQLTGTVSSKYDDYKVYKFAFHDTESAGLTFDETSVKVYVDGTEIETGYTVTSPAEDGHSFDVTFANLKDISSVHAGSVITVEYTSTLNKNAVLGSAGNTNKMHLEYSNNPNDAQGGEIGTTPDDTVIVFTYKVVANKVDENGNALKGASFKLEKKLSDGTWKDLGTIDGTDKSTFEWSGLDDGDYRITETATPAGYNSIDPIEFTIKAGHVVESDNPKLDSLEGGNLFTGEVSTGAVSANIVNKSGSTLPSTGGIGTTIFYVIGGILMVGAGVILISRKRTNK